MDQTTVAEQLDIPDLPVVDTTTAGISYLKTTHANITNRFNTATVSWVPIGTPRKYCLMEATSSSIYGGRSISVRLFSLGNKNLFLCCWYYSLCELCFVVSSATVEFAHFFFV